MNAKPTETLIDDEAVNTAFRNCLIEDDEIGSDGLPTVEYTKIPGIRADYGLHTERLQTHKEEVKNWIQQLPDNFMKSGGGGWTFLNLCNTKDGEQWTDFHQRMEQLVVLASGLGVAKFTIPKMLWSTLPGGVPYIVFDPEGGLD